MSKGTINVTVGRFICGQLRDHLNQCKFNGYNIDFIESSGWIERDFVIKGDLDDIKRLKFQLDSWLN